MFLIRKKAGCSLILDTSPLQLDRVFAYFAQVVEQILAIRPPKKGKQADGEACCSGQCIRCPRHGVTSARPDQTGRSQTVKHCGCVDYLLHAVLSSTPTPQNGCCAGAHGRCEALGISEERRKSRYHFSTCRMQVVLANSRHEITCIPFE